MFPPVQTIPKWVAEDTTITISNVTGETTTIPMADFIRRLVSGNKARHKDDDLDVELGLSESVAIAMLVCL